MAILIIVIHQCIDLQKTLWYYSFFIIAKDCVKNTMGKKKITKHIILLCTENTYKNNEKVVYIIIILLFFRINRIKINKKIKSYYIL